MIKRFLSKGLLSLGILFVFALASCDTAHKTNYLRDIEEAKMYSVKHDKGIVVQKGDKLRILVTSIRNPELTIPLILVPWLPRLGLACQEGILQA